MFNSNWFKTSLLFLGIIFIGLVTHMFITRDNMFIDSDSQDIRANIVCIVKADC